MRRIDNCGLLMLLVLLIAPACARAGAWPQAPGDTLVILKAERADADTALDLSGMRTDIPARRNDLLSVYFEHGLLDRLTLQGKLSYTSGFDGGFHYDGRGPFELGLRALVYRGKQTVVSAYVGGVLAGEGFNAGYAAPGAGKGDLELRLFVGRSAVWFHHNVFSEVQIARLERRKLPNEWRVDSTFGMEIVRNWQIFFQSYAGRADVPGVHPTWAKAEASVVRGLGPWSLQAGWRQTISGQEVPIEHGPVLAVWRRF